MEIIEKISNNLIKEKKKIDVKFVVILNYHKYLFRRIKKQKNSIKNNYLKCCISNFQFYQVLLIEKIN